MYKINVQKKEIVVYNPVFVKKQDNGKFGLCEKNEAEGIAYRGMVYPISELSEIGNEFFLEEQENKITELEMAVAQLSIIAAGGKAENLEGVANAWGNLIQKGKIKAEEVPDLNGLKEEVQKRIKGDNA